ncbi:MAG: NACHT domain-containing protein [Thermodesulfobacteriota bacterium]
MKDDNPITILWGTPGRGKSTYLSYLTQELQKEGAAVTRHHYFLSAEDSSSNRISFIQISTSLMDQLYVRHPEAMAGVAEDADKLRSAIGITAANLATKGQRLYIVVDGLDQVWRDTQRVDQLNHLFNELLPLPPNVSLIVGTQRVPDEQLPGKLLTIANEDDWIEIPRMDEVAVHRWVVQQDKARPLILRFDPTPQRRAEMIDEIARVFFNISQGHPLHLIYAYEGLIRAGRPTSAEEIQLLPPCPDGDIRVYYRGLWVRLSADAKNALHMLAGSDFFWPSLGIRQVLGDFSQIDHLLEPRNVGMVPFHSSIFAWVRERDDHAESYQALLPKIINWLANDAPEYWRWGWLWLARAQAGDFKDLLAGATRDWVVESLAKGWPDQQIVNILAVAEAKTFEDGDLPRTVSLRSLKTRVSNAREFQSHDFPTYRGTVLAVSDNRQQTLNLVDDIHDLTDSEVTQLARLGPNEMSPQILPACLNELARRVNAWIALRHRPEREFTELSDQLLSVSALMDKETVRRTLNYARSFKKPEPHVARFIRLLGDAQNIEGLQLVRKTLSGAKWKDHRRLIHDALIRAGNFTGADVRELVPLGKESLSAFAACCFLWRDRDAKIEVHIPPVPKDLIREHYSLGENAEVTSFFYEAFWTALYVGFCARGGDYSMIHPGLGEADLGWLPQGLAQLEEIARNITEGRLVPTFSAVYAEAADLEPVQWGPAPEREDAQYRAFNEALRRIAVDLHFLGLSDPGNTKVPASELSIARQSAHWSDTIWVTRNVGDRIPLLDKDGAAALLTDEAKVLSAKVTEFNERSGRWTELANLALLYEDGRQAEFLGHAAECLVSYGWRKDLHAMDVLDAVVELSAKKPAVTRAHIDTLVPIIEMITEFTDGDETNHVRSELIEVVAKVAPERLPSLYKHHLSTDDYSYADECLIELAKIMDLESPEGAALARTFLDERSLGVLEDRAVNEPAARKLLDSQAAFLGRPPKAAREIKATKEEELSEREKEAAKVDPTSFGYKDFAVVVEAAVAVHYRSREEFMVKWLHHWKTQGKALYALHSILSYFETSETTYGAEEILDEAFLVSLAVEGKDAAYPWLVKAHIHRHGWQSYYTSETETMTRIRLAAKHYPDRWLQYIKDTSVPAPSYRRRRYSFVVGYKYLVRFLMLVGQVELADKITTAFVDTLVEEVREQPIPETPWFLANSAPLALSFLFERLKWPVPMSRWRTAKEIRNLLNNPGTRSSTTDALLDYLDQCKTESEVCAVLTIVFLTSPDGRPTRTALASRVHCPSILADIILERTYGQGRGIGGWRQAHSGWAPADFEGGSYFEEHKTAHVPPIFVSNLRKLERISGYPFLQHWAYEWKTLRDKLGTHYTRYPHYFDDVLDARAGIMGQYWQRMREVFLSAYLRTLAYAVSEWRIPQRIAEGYCVEIVDGIAGFFDVEPGARPAWLTDFPERFCAPGADLTPLIRELVQAARAEGMRLVSLDTPVASSVQKFGNLTLSAHLVTPDYELPDGAFLYEKMPLLSIADTFELKGPPAEITIEEASTEGKTGDEVAVCSCLFPTPFGTWQSDYFGMGLRIPAPYTVTNTEIRCTHESIDCIASDGKVASRTRIWNDNWAPPHPKGGSTRCGTATMIDQEVLAEAIERLGRKLAFFIRLRIWDREKEYGDYSESKRTFFLLDLEG